MACTPGAQKCIGDNLYECRVHFSYIFFEFVYDWELKERNSPQCVLEPPPPEPEPEPEPTPTDEELLYANWLRTGGTGSMAYWRSLGSPLFYTPPPEPEPEPTDEELLYANWLRTGGTGSMAYWRSLGSPLFYTPPPEPEPELKGTIIKKELEYDESRKAIPVY